MLKMGCGHIRGHILWIITPKSTSYSYMRVCVNYWRVQLKNPPSLTVLFKVGVIGFEPTTPCSQSRVLTVYLPTRDSNSNGSINTFCVNTSSFFADFAYVWKSSCNRLMGMSQYRSVVERLLWPSSSRTNGILPLVCSRRIQAKVCRKLWKLISLLTPMTSHTFLKFLLYFLIAESWFGWLKTLSRISFNNVSFFASSWILRLMWFLDRVGGTSSHIPSTVPMIGSLSRQPVER